MNFLRTRPLVMKIMAVLNDGSEFIVANANYTAELETGAVLYATVLANPSETVGFRLYGKWATNETGCTASLSTYPSSEADTYQLSAWWLVTPQKLALV